MHRLTSLWVLLLYACIVLLFVCLSSAVGVEIYPPAIRSSAMSVSSTINWLSNFAVSLAFPHLSARLGPYAFVPFVAFLVLTSAFVGCAVPETRGKSVEEIAEELGVDEDEGDEWEVGEGVDGVGGDELGSVMEVDDGSVDDEDGGGNYQSGRSGTAFTKLKSSSKKSIK